MRYSKSYRRVCKALLKRDREQELEAPKGSSMVVKSHGVKLNLARGYVK